MLYGISLHPILQNLVLDLNLSSRIMGKVSLQVLDGGEQRPPLLNGLL